MEPSPSTRAVILVEGRSDQHAVETLARRHGRDLVAEGVAVLPVGGATNLGRYVAVWGPAGRDVPIAALYDAGETRAVRWSLRGSGLELDGDDAADDLDLEALGFFACDADLEDELIRTLGTDAVAEVFHREGEAGAFRTFQQQPGWRGRATARQMRRFLGTKSGRKVRYGGLLVDALDLGDVPRPLRMVLAAV